MTRKLGYLVLIVSFSIFSFRTDVLSYSSPVLHWSYFTGPTYELNFQNYSETLSQYSLFFSVLAKTISPNPFYSVWLLQAVLLNLVFFMGIWVTRASQYSLTIAYLFAALLLFIDPSTVGPQAYPSSSVVRFFPFYFCVFVYLFSLGNHSPLITRAIQYLAILLLFV